MRRTLVLFVLAVAIVAALVIPCLFAGSAAFAALAAFPPDCAMAIAAAVFASALAKATKFRLLAGRVDERAGLGDCAAVSLGADLGFLATPGGLGGYAATVYLFGKCGIRASAAATVAAADQVLDLMFFAAAVPLALLFTAGTQLPIARDEASSATPLLLLAILALVLFFATSRVRRRLAVALMRIAALRKRRASLRRGWAEVKQNVRDLLKMPPSLVAAVLLATALQWIARYAILELALAGLRAPAPFAPVLLIQAMALHAGQWTGIPGGVGGADILVLELLRPWGTPDRLGAAVVVWRIATFHLTLIAGVLAFAVVGARSRLANAVRSAPAMR